MTIGWTIVSVLFHGKLGNKPEKWKLMRKHKHKHATDVWECETILNDQAEKVPLFRWQNYVHNIVLETRQGFLLSKCGREENTQWRWSKLGDRHFPNHKTTLYMCILWALQEPPSRTDTIYCIFKIGFEALHAHTFAYEHVPSLAEHPPQPHPSGLCSGTRMAHNFW